MRIHKNQARIIAAIIVIFVCVAGWGLYSLKKDSADGRLLMWKIAARVMVENPATGVGPGYFSGGFGDAQAKYFSTGERSETEVNVAGCPEYGFNEYLQIGAETGVPGFILFAGLVCMALWRLFRRGSPYAFGLMALAVFAMFSYPLSLISMKTLFVAFLAVAGSQRGGIKVAQAITSSAVAICLVATILSIKPYLNRIEATKKWCEASRWYPMEMYSYVLDDYPPLMPLMRENSTFMFEYGHALNKEGR